MNQALYAHMNNKRKMKKKTIIHKNFHNDFHLITTNVLIILILWKQNK
jgi:hypothetical protein